MATLAAEKKFSFNVVLAEAKKTKKNLYEARLIAAGLSLNNHYFPPEVLAQAVHMFEGRPMYIDHPRTAADEAVRSLKDKAGKINRTWMSGPDMMAEIKISETASWVGTLIEEDIGGEVSIYVGALTEDSPQGYTLVKEITAVGSVDFVSEGAAGGQVLKIYEAFISNQTPMTLDELKKTAPQVLEEAKKEFLKEAEDAAKEEKKVEDEVKPLEEENAALKEKTEGLEEQVAQSTKQLMIAKESAIKTLCEGLPSAVAMAMIPVLLTKTEEEAKTVVEALRKELATKPVAMAAPTDGDSEEKANVVAEAFGVTNDQIEAVRSVYNF